jgi:erythromycin esterase-like protein
VRRAVTVTGDRLFDSRVEERALDRIVRGSRVVLAGEATHGTAEFFDAKVDLVEDRLERGGLTDVFLEDPLVDSVAAARYVALGEGTARDAVLDLAYDWWRAEHFVQLLETMRAHNVRAERRGAEPAFFLGMDVQGEPDDMVALVAGYVAESDPDAAPDVAAHLACFDLDYSAAEALVWSERSLAISSGEDPGVPDAVEASLNLRDAGMAAVTAAVFERDRDADVVVSLHNIHAADLRDAELALGGTGTVCLTSTGARLVDLLGARAVGSLGFSFGNGTFHAYDASGERTVSCPSRRSHRCRPATRRSSSVSGRTVPSSCRWAAAPPRSTPSDPCAPRLPAATTPRGRRTRTSPRAFPRYSTASSTTP